MNLNEILFVAQNMTKSEFKAYCDGNALSWLYRAENDKTNRSAKKYMFWQSAFEKHQSNCVDY